ncbi:MAG: ASKHA domain-containing protein [Chloroflexota bacterium]
MSEAGQVQLVLMPSGRRGRVPRGTNLLEASRQLGVELESICGGRQTCGKCQVIVEQGHFAKHGLTSAADHLSPMGEVEAAYCREHAIDGRRLACAAAVLDDVLITVPEESQARKQIVAKAATERAIDVKPAVRQVYVETEAGDLGDHRGDWERLQQALAEQWKLADPTIDLRALEELQPALRDGAASLASGRRGLTIALWQDREVLRIQPGYVEGVYGLAVDVGSTTVVAHLCDLRTGAVLATEAGMNPQVRFGEDLMSRVSYAMTEAQGLQRMHRAIVRTISELAERAAASLGQAPSCILDAVMVGNPVMIHLLLGLDPTALGGAPFAPAVSSPLDLKARDLAFAFHPAARLHILPCIAGHVGADHLAVLLAEAPHTQDEITLVIDVGTNAEMSLGNRQGLHCASSPTGPAFEGAQITHGQRAAPGAIERVRIDPETLEPRFRLIGWEPWISPGDVDLPPQARATGICGSGIIEAVAEMFLVGILGADGGFAGPARSTRLRWQGLSPEYVLADAGQTASGQPIVITQNDVRPIQLAKAAIYAGVKLLMAHREVTRVDRVALAGAFGSYIDPFHAMVLGMIPDCELDRVAVVGNAAGDGARIALLNQEQRAEAARLANWVRHVQTATDPAFQDEFVAAMALPHAVDRFPHLQEFLPTNPGSGPGRARRRTSTMQPQRSP